MKTALPTVEGVLFEAFVKARLVDPDAGFEGCGWEKCGRTDRGVSAAGQVISLWVRSALEGPSGVDLTLDRASMGAAPVLSPVTLGANHSSTELIGTEEETHLIAGLPGLEFAFDEDDITQADLGTSLPHPATRQTKSEHNYIAILNRLLPPTIRILAWSPIAADFSARFSCTYRHYKYFFSSELVPGPPLDIDCMRVAASRLIGEHDFRNLCKVDPGKQITMFKRVVTRADIEPVSVDHNGQGMYVFNLIGSAFLYHQVRHIMAVLFMIGSGVEDSSVISALMNVDGSEKNAVADGDHLTHDLEVVECKPEYQMAGALPLILWDCGYPAGSLDWRTTSHEPPSAEENKHELYQQLHSIYSRSQIYATLNEHFLAAASPFHPPPSEQIRGVVLPLGQPAISKYPIPLGGGSYKRTTKYIPLLDRNRLDPVDVINERWRLGKGLRRKERMERMDSMGAGSEDLDGSDSG